MEIRRAIKFGLVLMILFLSFCGTEEVKETTVQKDSNIVLKEKEKKERLKKIEDITKKIENEKNNPELYNERGDLKSDNEDFKGAIEDFTTAISMNPKYANAFYNRGLAKRNLEKHKEAIEDYTKAISINPNDADYYGSRGYSKLELEDNKGAIDDYSKAILLNPKDGEAFHNRAIAKVRLGNFEGVKEDFEFALKNESITQDQFNAQINWVSSMQNIASIASAAKIRVDQILDLRDDNVRKEFLLSWYNSKENPDIENKKDYSENEFKYQEDKKKFQDYRKYKYAITNSYLTIGDYDFKKGAFRISTNPSVFNSLSFGGYDARHLELKKPLELSNTIQSNTWFSISTDKAEKFKQYEKEDDVNKNVIILTKFSPAAHTTTGKCNYPDTYFQLRDEQYKICKKEFENKQLKLKYLSTETLKYRIVYSGEVYKNY